VDEETPDPQGRRLDRRAQAPAAPFAQMIERHLVAERNKVRSWCNASTTPRSALGPALYSGTSSRRAGEGPTLRASGVNRLSDQRYICRKTDQAGSLLPNSLRKTLIIIASRKRLRKTNQFRRDRSSGITRGRCPQSAAAPAFPHTLEASSWAITCRRRRRLLAAANAAREPHAGQNDGKNATLPNSSAEMETRVRQRACRNSRLIHRRERYGIAASARPHMRRPARSRSGGLDVSHRALRARPAGSSRARCGKTIVVMSDGICWVISTGKER